jgi:hypothetical protein
VSGSFAELVCGVPAKVVVETSSGEKTFVLEDPNKVTITGRETGTAELSCGPQKRARIRVDYKAPANANSDGIVLAIHFDP